MNDRISTIRALAVACCGLVVAASGHAAGLFKPCDSVRADKSFASLSDYFASRPDDPQPLYCAALSRDAFVFTTRGDFLDCRVASGANGLRCSPSDAAFRYPDLDLLASFSGGGKSFALFHQEGLERGEFDEAYEVFYLVPRHVDARGYRILFLDGAGARDQTAHSGQCASAEDLQAGQAAEDVVVADDTPFEILHDGRNDVTIRFNQHIVRCPGGEIVDHTIAWRWSGDRFAKVIGK